jgi:aminoglycoside phosphotransferase (APT) family kinase protein
VVFADDHAAALLDFDFAAPGDPVHDIMRFALMCVPIDDDVNATRLGWCPAGKSERLRLIADTFGLDVAGRHQLLTALSTAVARGGEFVRRRVQAGDPGFVRMWSEMGGAERFSRRHRWWVGHQDDFAKALR